MRRTGNLQRKRSPCLSLSAKMRQLSVLCLVAAILCCLGLSVAEAEPQNIRYKIYGGRRNRNRLQENQGQRRRQESKAFGGSEFDEDEDLDGVAAPEQPVFGYEYNSRDPQARARARDREGQDKPFSSRYFDRVEQYPGNRRRRPRPRTTTTTTTTTTRRPRTYAHRRGRPAAVTQPPRHGIEEGETDEYGNLLVHLGHRKEDRSCPEGWVLDIWGYCREAFHEESRDWDWWINIRNFILGSRNSGYQSSY